MYKVCILLVLIMYRDITTRGSINVKRVNILVCVHFYTAREVLRQSAQSKHRDFCAAKHKGLQLHMRSPGKEGN
jgi:hypothetical protein